MGEATEKCGISRASGTMKINKKKYIYRYMLKLWVAYLGQARWKSTFSDPWATYVHAYQIFPARNSLDCPKCSAKRLATYWTWCIFPVWSRLDRTNWYSWKIVKVILRRTGCPFDWLTVLYFFAAAVCTTCAIFIEFVRRQRKQCVTCLFENTDFYLKTMENECAILLSRSCKKYFVFCFFFRSIQFEKQLRALMSLYCRIL